MESPMRFLNALQTVATCLLGVAFASGVFGTGFGSAAIVPLQLLLMWNNSILPLLLFLFIVFVVRTYLDAKFQIFSEVSNSVSFVFLLTILVLIGVVVAEWLDLKTTTFEQVLQMSPVEFASTIAIIFIGLSLAMMVILAIIQWAGEMARTKKR